ncbi:hypothetical protein H0H87_000138 [Tephrocybe sp. NHM501043]|nr:hypothetical protein H0H87_000138 [Tephrocybe sp. NHM501043]
MASTIPKAVLYYAPNSIWSAAVLLTLEEKGYGADEIDRKQVDLVNGANFDPTFLRLNPKATLPTLVVPMQNTLADGVNSRYKALTETEAIIDFLDKSRSATSRTRTTSHAPAPALRPATIAFNTKTKTIIDALHSEGGNPNHLAYVNARNEAALQMLTVEKLPVLTRKHKALDQYISDADNDKLQVSLKTKDFWQRKKEAVAVLLAVIENGQKADAKLTGEALRQREQFYAEARKSWEVSLKEVVVKVNSEVIGPFSLGDQLSIADLHLASWLARLVKLSGGVYGDEGDKAIGKLETHIGGDFRLVKDFEVEEAQGKAVKQSKLAAFWDATQGRESWKQVYRQGLY